MEGGEPAMIETVGPVRLHIGSGNVRLKGWINMDVQPLPGVDVIADVTRGLDFVDRSVEAVFSEHFLEHLALDDALRFLAEVHRVLAEGAWLRISTPNLDWVWHTHYRLEGTAGEKRAAAFAINRAFRGWRHQFVWNREMLEEALAACGFEEIRWCRRGESDLPLFRGLEHHDTYEDVEDLPHILIAEARKGPARPERLRELRDTVQVEWLAHMDD
jgi:predicted SAM-dependent methyltransferase